MNMRNFVLYPIMYLEYAILGGDARKRADQSPPDKKGEQVA